MTACRSFYSGAKKTMGRSNELRPLVGVLLDHTNVPLACDQTVRGKNAITVVFALLRKASALQRSAMLRIGLARRSTCRQPSRRNRSSETRGRSSRTCPLPRLLAHATRGLFASQSRMNSGLLHKVGRIRTWSPTYILGEGVRSCTDIARGICLHNDCGRSYWSAISSIQQCWCLQGYASNCNQRNHSRK